MLRIVPASLTRLCLIEVVAEDVLQAGSVRGWPEHEAGLGLALRIQRDTQIQLLFSTQVQSFVLDPGHRAVVGLIQDYKNLAKYIEGIEQVGNTHHDQ